MLTTGQNLGLLDNGEYGEAYYHELLRFFRGVDVLVQPRVISSSTGTPPPSPTDGDAYIIPAGATGAWAGKQNLIARWTTRSAAGDPPGTPCWEFFTPKRNWQVGVDDRGADGAMMRFNGTTWVTGGEYTLPPATVSELGGIKQGVNVTVAPDGTLTVNTGAFETAGAVAAHLLAANPHPQYAFTAGDGITIDAGEISVTTGMFEYAGTMSTHLGATDPHPQYLQQSEGDARYLQSLAKATTYSLGGVIVGTNLTVDVNGVLSANPGGYTLPAATAGTLGGVKVGDNLSIDGSGVLSANPGGYTLPTASGSVLGGVKVGANLSIDGGGVLSATSSYSLPEATDTTLGGIKVGANLTIDAEGVLAATAYTLPIATDTVLGGVKQGSNVTINGTTGVITVNAGAFETAGAVAAHEAAGDPHPQYLTPTEGNASYSALGHTHNAENLTPATVTTTGHVGVGSTVSGWNIGQVVQVGAGGNFMFGDTYQQIFGTNSYYNDGWKRRGPTYKPTQYNNADGVHRWYSSAAGSADTAITWSQLMTLDDTGLVTSVPATVTGLTVGSLAGLLKAAAGAVSAATAGTDYAKPDTASSWTAQQTFKELKATVHTITDGAAFEIDPANGEVQVVTLGASRTPAATNFEDGQFVLLGIDDGSAYSLTWTTVNPTWVKPGGTASAPTLATTGLTWILFWKRGGTIYAAEAGKP